MRTFVDGAEINAEQFGYNTISPGAAWTSIPTVINDLATFRAWRDFEPSVNKNISLTNAQCWECWGYDLRGDRGQQAGGYNEEAFVFPMYLALDVADQRAHRGADIDATVRSWIAFQDSLVPGTETNFVTWRRKLAAEGREGDMRSQALFIESGRIRSEDQDYVEGYSSIEITSDVAWQMTSENEAYPNPNSLNGVLSTFTLNGPVHMGVSATLDPETYYMGHIAEVSLYTRALDAEMIDCAYRDVINGGDIAVCRSPWDIPQRSYANDLVENGIGTSGNNGARVQLFGDTVMHPDLGLVFDGDGDYATVRTGDYANDGTYTLQFWFTRTDCLAPTNRTGHELLFSHVGNQTMRDISTGPGGEMPGNPEIDVMVACPGFGGDPVSTVGQLDVIRVVMRSDDDLVATFDAPLDAYEAGSGQSGLITDLWVMITLTVGVEDSATVMRMYYDGNELGTDNSASTFGVNAQQARVADADNLALTGLPDRRVLLNPMRGLLGGSTLGEAAYLGSAAGGRTGFFTGSISGLAIYRQPTQPLDVSCSFEYGESLHLSGTTAGDAPTAAWECEDLVGEPLLDTMPGLDCPTALTTLEQLGGCDLDLSVVSTRPEGSFLRDLCPVSCDNCPELPTADCVIGADDPDGIIPNVLGCAEIIGFLGATVETACGGLTVGTLSPLLGGADPTMLISDLCMATCGVCVGGTEGTGGVSGGPANSHAVPVVETMSTASSRKDGYDTYQLALELNPELVGNVYTIYAVPGETPPLSFPPAYQTPAPFGVNVGGTNPQFWAFSADAQWDSWLTVGLTDGSNQGAISHVGLDFDTWGEGQGLSATDGALFWMNPPSAPPIDELRRIVVIAQITVPSGTSFEATISAQGSQASMAVGETWSAPGITFRV